MGIKKGSTLKFKRNDQKVLKKAGLKGCQKCGRTLTRDSFRKQNTKDGRASCCKYCRHVQDCKKKGKTFLSESDFYHKVNREYKGYERLHIKSLQRRFEIPFEEAKALTEVTNCQICGKSKKENGKLLAVDHCHKTGKIRGVLCNNCNSGLGKFKDNIDFMKKAIKYLKDNK